MYVYYQLNEIVGLQTPVAHPKMFQGEETVFVITITIYAWNIN